MFIDFIYSNYLFKIYNFKFENIYKNMFQTKKTI